MCEIQILGNSQKINTQTFPIIQYIHTINNTIVMSTILGIKCLHPQPNSIINWAKYLHAHCLI